MIHKTVSRTELKRLYETMTVREAAKHLDITQVMLYQLLDRAGIERKNRRIVFDITD